MRALLLLSLATIVGCRRPAPPTNHVERESPPPTPDVVRVDASADVDEGVDAEAEPTEPRPFAASWTEPAAVNALAADCHFEPPSTVQGMGDGPDPLRCEDGITEQSCNFDPCHDGVDTPCREGCGRTCTGCDQGCRAGCDRCRAGCHDEACVRACAASCAGCLNGCLEVRDRCTSAGCTAQYQACALRAAQRFRGGPCLAVCRRCTASCARRDDEMGCVGRCLGRQRGCTTEQGNYCSWNGPDFGLEEIARSRDAGAADARP